MVQGVKSDDAPPGSRWRKETLGSVAVYEVVRVADGMVEARVVEAPGLTPGRTVRLTLAALSAMRRVPPG